MFNKLDIVARIISLLSANKIPATKFAEDMGGKERGYSKDTVYTWRTNRSTSYMDDLGRIAQYFNVSTDYLLTGKENDITNDTINERENGTMSDNFRINKNEALSKLLDAFLAITFKHLDLNDALTEMGGDIWFSDDYVSMQAKTNKQLLEIAKHYKLDDAFLWFWPIAKEILDDYQSSLKSPLENKVSEILHRFDETEQLHLIAELSAAANRIKSEKDAVNQ